MTEAWLKPSRNIWGRKSKPVRKVSLRVGRLFADDDRDGVANVFDCRPKNPRHQDFGKWKGRSAKPGQGIRGPEEITAARRFGGANIKRLKQIGSGRDRVVYQLDKNKVLKIAKTPGGLTQNIPEQDLGGYLGHLEHFESGKDYVVMEKAEPRGKATKKFIRGLKKAQYDTSAGTFRSGISEKARDYLEKKGYGDLMDYEINKDILHKTSWGEKEGEPVLTDAGALLRSQDLKNFRIKHLRESAAKGDQAARHDLQEWREIQAERRRFGRKGEKIETPREEKVEVADEPRSEKEERVE